MNVQIILHDYDSGKDSINETASMDPELFDLIGRTIKALRDNPDSRKALARTLKVIQPVNWDEQPWTRESVRTELFNSLANDPKTDIIADLVNSMADAELLDWAREDLEG